MCDESGGEGLASKKRVGLRWYRGVETGSAGIESKLSVFIQPTLQSLIK